MSDNRLFWDISKLQNWDKNPREIKENDFERLKKQIIRSKEITGEYLYKPLLITADGIVLGGNMRLKALRELGIKDIWVNIVNTKNEQEMMEIALSDNDRAGYYNSEDLLEWVEKYPQLKWADYAVDLKEPVNLQVLIDKFAPVTEDDAPPLAEGEPDSQIGQIYQLGRHRLLCGDSTSLVDVERLMGGGKADMVFTDPPYRLTTEKFGNKGNRKYGKLDSSKVFAFDDWIKNVDKVVADNSRILVWENFVNTYDLWGSLKKYFDVRGLIIWYAVNRTNFFKNPNTGLFNKYDICIQASRGKKRLNDCPTPPVDLISESVEHLSRSGQDSVFGAKPISILVPYIFVYSDKENIVLDLFGGSGSTLIACEQTNRVCYMAEIDPRYCDVIRKRYAKFIGKEAEWKEITPIITKN